MITIHATTLAIIATCFFAEKINKNYLAYRIKKKQLETIDEITKKVSRVVDDFIAMNLQIVSNPNTENDNEKGS